MSCLVLFCEAGNCSQKIAQCFHSIFLQNTAIFHCEEKFNLADFDQKLDNYFWTFEHASCSQQNTVHYHLQFSRFLSQLLITHELKNFSLFQNHYQKFIWRIACLGVILPVGKVSRESYLPKRKMYLDEGKGFFFGNSSFAPSRLISILGNHNQKAEIGQAASASAN